jgi:3',5'-cyclic AMP phosphodiesterase CpdA
VSFPLPFAAALATIAHAMSAIFDQPIDRRAFLKTTGKALVGAGLAAQMAPAPSAAESEDSLHFALLSDTHIPADPKNEYRKFFPTENLRMVVSQVVEARPRGAIIDGDIARLSGQLEDYQAIKQLLEPLAAQCPIYMALGNHDDRANFHKVFPPEPDLAQNVSGKHVLVFERPFVRLILLDSLLYVNQVAGLLGKNQRTWLDQYLASTDTRPTVLFVHHTLRDNDGDLLDVDRLFSIVRPYRKVKAIFYGHSHEYNFRQEQGLHLVNLPAVGYNFRDTEPVGWVDAHFSRGGVDLELRAVGGSTEKHGKTVSLSWI